MVYKKDNHRKMLCEFDGMIIFTNRSSKQVVFLESKNTSGKPVYGKNCLNDRLEKLQLDFDSKETRTYGKDVILFYDI